MNNTAPHLGFCAAACVLGLLAIGALSGCCVVPLRVAEPLRVTVVDSQNGQPIPQAKVLYVVCDVHDWGCKGGKFIKTYSDFNRRVEIPGERKWGFYIAAPGGLPVPNHIVAIWAPGYYTYLFAAYDDTIDKAKKHIKRPDILAALDEVPQDHISNYRPADPDAELIGGKVGLIRLPTNR